MKDEGILAIALFYFTASIAHLLKCDPTLSDSEEGKKKNKHWGQNIWEVKEKECQTQASEEGLPSNHPMCQKIMYF